MEQRIAFSVSEHAHSDLVELARETHRSVTEVVRIGLGLAVIVLQAEKQGHVLMIVNASGDAISQVVPLPVSKPLAEADAAKAGETKNHVIP